jgi:SAM-dependent methyltransferase
VGWGGLPQVFDAWNKEWKTERERLEALLPESELESARASTLNAHYTAPVVIRAMFAALQRFGFERGRILEPACGLGHFFGLMPEEMLRPSQITGIEIDSVTARLAKQLYPDADIRRQPFEETRLADSFFDVAISNIPFGDYRPFDSRFKQWKLVIHDYFFAATLEKVRPGGLILFVTSKGTLDKVEGGLRELISQQADLLGAIRLPNDAFKRNANTEVTTDIVMLRKRFPGESPKGSAWKALGEITNSHGETIPLNEYFVAHPEMMLGEMRLEGGLYRRGEPSLISNGRDLGEQLAEAIAMLPRNVFTPHRTAIRPPTLDQTVPAPENIKPNAYAVVNDRIGIREGDNITILEGLSALRTQRIRGLIRVRDAVRRCLRTQLEANVGVREDMTTGALWTNALYEFKKTVGHLQRCELASLLRRDLQWPVKQVESWFEVEGVKPELIDRFSTRRKEVLAQCKAMGDYSAVAAEEAVRVTRQAKEHVPREQLFPQWREVGKEFGWAEKEVTQLRGAAKSIAARNLELGLLAEAVRTAMGKHQGTLTRAEVLEAVASVTQDSGLSARQIAAAVYSAAPKFRRSDGVKNERQLAEFAEAIRAGRKEAREQLRTINEAQRRMIHLEARLKKAFESTQKKAEAKAQNREHRTAQDQGPSPEQARTDQTSDKKTPGTHEDSKEKSRADKRKEQGENPGQKDESKEESRRARERSKASKGQEQSAEKEQASQKKGPFASFRIRKEEPQQGPPRWAIDLRFFRLEVRDVHLFRSAPNWNPVSKLKLPGLVVTPNPDPLGLKRRFVLPLDRARIRMQRQIRETLAAVLATGVKRILFRDDRVNSTQWKPGEWGLGDKQLRRSQIVIADTDLAAFRGLLNDWTGKAMKYPEDNVILTQTRKRADVLNKAAQKRRKKGGHIAKTGTLVGGTIVHQNDRIIFRRGKRSYGVEPDDLGTVTKINSIHIRVALDSGKTVTIPTGSCPTVDLAYAVTHRDARKSRSHFAHVLFEANDSAQELAAIVKQRTKTPVRIYVASGHTKFFTADGHARMRDQYGTEEETKRAEQEKLRAAREAEEKRRKEDDIRREEEKRRRAAGPSNSQSNSQSHGHSH